MDSDVFDKVIIKTKFYSTSDKNVYNFILGKLYSPFHGIIIFLNLKIYRI